MIGERVAALVLVALGIPVVAATEPLERTTQRGPVTATVRLEPAEPVIGDVLSLTVDVLAEPEVEVLMPAFGEALAQYAIVDFAPHQELDDEGRTRATQRYRIQPSRSGKQAIPPILIEFVDRRAGHSPAPEGRDAHELLTERLDFEVASVLPEGVAQELRGPLGELAKITPPGSPLWPWLVGGALLLSFAGPFGFRALMEWRRRARRRTAYEIARARLDRLVVRPDPGSPEEIDAFFVELSGVVRDYLEARFELRSPELTTEEFLELMSDSPDLSHEHQRLLQGFLRRADLVKFAGHLPAEEDIRDSVRAAERFLEETRENAPLIDNPLPGSTGDAAHA
jgi:hypothetical protein